MQIEKLLRTELNPSQYLAATTLDGPLLVVAGAGTGKTRVIEYRVLYLVSREIHPRSILLLTFTRRAAREMLSRASRHNRLCEEVVGGTFHSFGFSVITEFADLLGFKRPLSFLDEADSEEQLHRLAVKLGFTRRKRRFPSKRTLKAVISASFNRGESIGEVLLRDYPHFLHWSEEIEKLREEYVRYKVEHNLLDYDDLLIYLKILLEDDRVRRVLSSRYRYIMVDEYQDTNQIQAQIVYLLAKENRNVMAVGDDAQSIYAFRGARYQNMFEFLEVFPEAKVIKLEQNYRSTQPILDLANAVMEGAKHKYTKVLKAQREGSVRPALLFFKDPEGEAEWIAEKVKELWDEGVPLHHIGVLFRSMYIVRPLEISLTRRGIPYRTYGGLKFIETAHIKDLVSHVKVVANPLDELAWHRVLMLIDGIGPRTAERMISEILRTGEWRPALAAMRENPRSGPGISRLYAALERATAPNVTFPEVVSTLIDYYLPILRDKYDDYQRRAGDIDSLRQIARSYRSVETFLLDLVAIEPAEQSVEERQDLHLDVRPLVLSTIHSAKGLEWEVVFIMGVAEGHLPISYSHLSEEDIEEERRLLYVAITRAKRELFLTMSHEGYRGGITTFCRLSRFLDDPQVLKFLEVSGQEQL
ncbi:MAG: ATP-dependent helicase, partial [Deltaproteobacteria bacterium]